MPLDYAWEDESWRGEARELKDHRTPRHDTPQYQTEDDRLAAIGRYGDEIACEVCAPTAIPVS